MASPSNAPALVVSACLEAAGQKKSETLYHNGASGPFTAYVGPQSGWALPFPGAPIERSKVTGAYLAIRLDLWASSSQTFRISLS
jgi:hypothetical protein